MVTKKKSEEQTTTEQNLEGELDRLDQSQSTKLVPRSSTVITIGEGVAFHPGDVRPPLLRMVQNGSADGTPGKFRKLDTEEELDDLRVTAIRVQPIRTKWPAGGFARDRVPECRSHDGVRAVARFSDDTVPRFPGRLCAECEFFTSAPWRAAEGEERGISLPFGAAKPTS